MIKNTDAVERHMVFKATFRLPLQHFLMTEGVFEFLSMACEDKQNLQKQTTLLEYPVKIQVRKRPLMTGDLPGFWIF